MKNKLLLLCVAIILIISSVFIYINKTKGDMTNYLGKVDNVIIYSIDIETAKNYDTKKLSQIGFTTIYNPKYYFSKITYKDEMIIWKGDRLGIIHMKDGSEFKIRVSNYGEFFSIVGEDGYYIYDTCVTPIGGGLNVKRPKGFFYGKAMDNNINFIQYNNNGILHLVL